MLFSRFSRWLDQNFFFIKLVDIYHGKIHKKKIKFTNFIRKVRAAHNFIKDKMTRRVDILLCNFAKIKKKLRIKSQERKNVVFGQGGGGLFQH